MSWQRGWGEATPGTDARPVHRGRLVTLSRGELDDMVGAAERRGRNLVKRVGVPVALIIGSLIGMGASAALGETIHIGGVYVHGVAAQGTSVSLAPSDEPGVLAVVTMENRHVNDGGDTGVYPLVMGDLAIEVEFIWDADPVLGSDRIVVTPPLGVTCEPADCGVTVLEGLTGTVTLFDWRGM